LDQRKDRRGVSGFPEAGRGSGVGVVRKPFLMADLVMALTEAPP
jgi:hypothetical protein